MRTHLSALLEESVFTSAHIRMFSYVPAEVRAEAQKVRSTYDVRWRELVDAIAESGLLREGVDPSSLRLAILEALNWSLEWYQTGAASPALIAARWFDLFTLGAVKRVELSSGQDPRTAEVHEGARRVAPRADRKAHDVKRRGSR